MTPPPRLMSLGTLLFLFVLILFDEGPDEYPGLEDLLEFTLSMSVHLGLPHYLPAEHADGDLGDLPKEFRLLKDPMA